jgi:sugar phosphate isomerase/epimerase
MLFSATAPLENAERLKELGYDGIDVGLTGIIYHDDPLPHNPMLDDEDYEPILDRHMARCKELGLQILTAHIPYRFDYTDPTIENYDYYCNMTVRALRAAEYLGAEWAVVHVKKAEDTVAYVKKLWRDAGVQRIGIAIENLPKYSLAEVIEAHDTLESEGYRVGVCLDTGHCHINKYFSYDVAEAVRVLGKRIKMLHVHDNSRNGDSHFAPFMGSIKWKSVMEALADIGYEGAFNFELQPGKIPAEAREEYERYCVATARYLISIFETRLQENAKKQVF